MYAAAEGGSRLLQRLQRGLGRRLFGLFLAVAGTGADGQSVELHLRLEGLVMIRPRLTDHMVGEHLIRLALDQLLQSGLVVPAALLHHLFLLGIQKPVIKAHGSSDARAIENAVLRAKEYAESGFIADIQANIEHMRVQPAAEKN